MLCFSLPSADLVGIEKTIIVIGYKEVKGIYSPGCIFVNVKYYYNMFSQLLLAQWTNVFKLLC